ncbi:MAG: DUF6263 family protein [Chitinophagales bacterium]|nr:DUF6263 family protein [Chitinophagales bacterium]
MRRLLFVLFSLLLFASCKGRDKTDKGLFLELNLHSGQKFETQISINQGMESSDDESMYVTEQNLEFHLLSEIVQDSSNVYSIKNQYKRFQLFQSVLKDENEDIVSIDTKNFQSIGDCQNDFERFYYQMTKDSFISKVRKNYDEIENGLDVLIKNAKGDKFTSPYQLLFSYFIYYPDYYVDDKEEWLKEINITQNKVHITGNIKYQLQTWNDENVYIKMSANLNAKENTLDFSKKTDVQQMGLITVSRKTFWLKEMDIEQNVTWYNEDGDSYQLSGNVKIKSKELK